MVLMGVDGVDGLMRTKGFVVAVVVDLIFVVLIDSAHQTPLHVAVSPVLLFMVLLAVVAFVKWPCACQASNFVFVFVFVCFCFCFYLLGALRWSAQSCSKRASQSKHKQTLNGTITALQTLLRVLLDLVGDAKCLSSSCSAHRHTHTHRQTETSTP